MFQAFSPALILNIYSIYTRAKLSFPAAPTLRTIDTHQTCRRSIRTTYDQVRYIAVFVVVDSETFLCGLTFLDGSHLAPSYLLKPILTSSIPIPRRSVHLTCPPSSRTSAPRALSKRSSARDVQPVRRLLPAAARSFAAAGQDTPAKSTSPLHAAREDRHPPIISILRHDGDLRNPDAAPQNVFIVDAGVFLSPTLRSRIWI
ncbi:hypothetical protein R3P38DRAFT_2937300 [Favolaschia claudopus]|uniref:Uncharacterized protein n=1 Tax=Favolaschia claudopus TaxID=2862362 RepID=A0AAW0BP68_9AGAR